MYILFNNQKFQDNISLNQSDEVINVTIDNFKIENISIPTTIKKYPEELKDTKSSSGGSSISSSENQNEK